jgi:putative transposase
MLAHCRMVSQLWNAMLQRQEDSYRRVLGGLEGKKHLTFFDLTGEITALRRECPEWAELSVCTAHRVADALTKAFDAFFRRAKKGEAPGYPRYRSAKHANWLPHRLRVLRGRDYEARASSSASGCSLRAAVERQGGGKHRNSWWLTLKGVPGEIHCRGELKHISLATSDADIRCRDGVWWLSIAVETAPRRTRGVMPVTVRFDLVDGFAVVNNRPVSPPPLVDNDKIAALQQAMAKAPRGSDVYHALRRRKARLEARAARCRREYLHEWTTDVVRHASALTVIRPAPSIKEATQSGRGSERAPGANVKLKAEFNRRLLEQSPSMAIAMLAYKAAEAGIDYQEAATTEAMVGNHAVTTAKALRRTRRTIRKEAHETAGLQSPHL